MSDWIEKKVFENEKIIQNERQIGEKSRREKKKKKEKERGEGMGRAVWGWRRSGGKVSNEGKTKDGEYRKRKNIVDKIKKLYFYLIYVRHCWRSKDIFLWTPAHGRASIGRLTRTYIQQLCTDTGCSLEDQLEAIYDRDEWGERLREIRATSATRWWWFLCTLIF